jgi:thymidine kinase
MAKLYFRYGAMNCGKSTAVIQVAYNYEEMGMRVILLKPKTDTKIDEHVSSRLGAKRKVDLSVSPNDNLFSFIKKELSIRKKIGCVIVDEAQFLEPEHIDQLLRVTLTLNVPVLCYGLRTDFKTHCFPASCRLLEVAHSIEEVKTICACGKKATFTGRKQADKFIAEGSQVAIDGKQKITYESLCGGCYLKLVGPIAHD